MKRKAPLTSLKLYSRVHDNMTKIVQRLTLALALVLQANGFLQQRTLQVNGNCGELVGCALADIVNWNIVANLLGEEVTYVIDENLQYSIACYVVNGAVDEIVTVFGNGETHSELTAPYWVGGELPSGLPVPIAYLTTPGQKVLDVTGTLGSDVCFEHIQTLQAVSPGNLPSDESPTPNPTE